MKDTSIVKAEYRATGVTRFKDNPFIEALPPIEKSKDDFLIRLANYPPSPTAKDRKAGDIVRIMELSVISDVVHPFPEFQKAGIAISSMMRQTYVARNPLTVIDRQRRHALAMQEADNIPFPASWKSSAMGHLMMSVSGMGKTTFALSFLMHYPQVIRHTAYKNQPLTCHQIVYIVLRLPHDATLRSLCIQFFEQVDRLLGTDYTRQARALRQIAPTVELMNQVATAVSLGFLVIDEVQNLKHARGGTAEYMLNLFSEIIERLGISLLILATPAVQSVLEGSVRNVRKLTSGGETILPLMGRRDPQWKDFCEVLWDYCYTRKKVALSESLRNAWHDCSGGNTAFATLAFILSQRNEIGGREVIDETAFARTAAVDMGFLQPAIRALNSENADRLRAFDDLLFSSRYRELRQLLGVRDIQDAGDSNPEFDEVSPDAAAGPSNASKKGARPSKANRRTSVEELPMEDPFLR